MSDFKYLSRAQQCINTTWNRSIGTTLFILLFEVCSRLKDDPEIIELLSKEFSHNFDEKKNDLRMYAHTNIQKIQRENQKRYDNKRKKSKRYKEGDPVAIKRMQRGLGLKFVPQYLRSYEIIRVLRSDRYVVCKIREHCYPRL